MSLFDRLFRLRTTDARRPTEDFLTEIVAAVLTEHPELFWAWASPAWEPYDPAQDRVWAETQTTRTALSNCDHGSDSRLDLVVRRIREAALVSVAYVESKVASGEGYEQLQRYTDHLAREPADERLLVYATRDTDDKDTPSPHPSLGVHVLPFIPLRWSGFDRALRNHRPQVVQRGMSTFLLDQTRAFLRSHGMSDLSQLTPFDLVNLSQAGETMRKMRAALEPLCHVGSTLHQLTAINRNKLSVNWNQLAQHNRIVIAETTSSRLFGRDDQPPLRSTIIVGFWSVEDRFEARISVEMWGGEPMHRQELEALFKHWEDTSSEWKQGNHGTDWHNLTARQPLEPLIGKAFGAELLPWFTERLKELRSPTPPVRRAETPSQASLNS